jgi:hypothetical protein
VLKVLDSTIEGETPASGFAKVEWNQTGPTGPATGATGATGPVGPTGATGAAGVSPSEKAVTTFSSATYAGPTPVAIGTFDATYYHKAWLIVDCTAFSVGFSVSVTAIDPASGVLVPSGSDGADMSVNPGVTDEIGIPLNGTLYQVTFDGTPSDSDNVTFSVSLILTN